MFSSSSSSASQISNTLPHTESKGENVNYRSNQVTYTFAPPNNKVLYVEYNNKKYTPTITLGKGTFSKVDRCTADDGEVIALKTTPIQRQDKSEMADAIYLLKSDISILQKLYPTDGNFYSVRGQNTDKFLTKGKPSDIVCNLLTTMPCFPGKSLNKTLHEAPNFKKRLEIILAITKELQRIHQLGILHGDIKSDNIIVDASQAKPIVHFIDFEWNYDIGDEYAEVTPKRKSRTTATYWPIERTNDNEVKPDFSQDIYSLGHALHLFFKNTQNTQPSHKKIIRIFAACLDDDATKRPTLNVLITQVDKALAFENELSKQLNNNVHPIYRNNQNGNVFFNSSKTKSSFLGKRKTYDTAIDIEAEEIDKLKKTRP